MADSGFVDVATGRLKAGVTRAKSSENLDTALSIDDTDGAQQPSEPPSPSMVKVQSRHRQSGGSSSYRGESRGGSPSVSPAPKKIAHLTQHEEL